MKKRPSNSSAEVQQGGIEMMRKLALHLACAKYVITPKYSKRYVTARAAFPLCVRRNGHTYGTSPASIALRVWRWVNISS